MSSPDQPPPEDPSLTAATDPDDDLELELLAPAEDLPPWSLEAQDDLSVRCFGRRPSPPLVAVTADALLDILGHGSAETGREVGGILLGDFRQAPQGPLTRVTDIIIADTAEASLTHVTFTHESWAQIHRQLDQRSDGVRIVGWYHTHPGFGPFLSAHDLFIQQNFFSDRRHVALVLDPIQRTLAAFGWREDTIVKTPGFWAFAPCDQEQELDALLAELSYAGDPDPGPLKRLRTWLGR